MFTRRVIPSPRIPCFAVADAEDRCTFPPSANYQIRMFSVLMKYSLIAALLLPVLVSATEATPKLREQKIALSENREVLIAVPDGFALVTGQDDSGLPVVKLNGPKDSVTIDLHFLPDP